MSMPSDYLEYPNRKYGMDHDIHGWSLLQKRDPVKWPNGAKIALWVSVCMEFFPLNQPAKPFKAPGGMAMPYPDLRFFTTRDYGNRVGIQRVWRVLEKHGIKGSMAVNSEVASRYPSLIDAINERGHEIIAHGVDMGKLHYGDMDDGEEANLVKGAVTTLRDISGQPVRGWWSPAKSQSWNTLKHLADNGIDYCCDWVNDDMPYGLNAKDGREITAMPHSGELWDRTILIDKKANEPEFVEQIQDAFTVLYNEADQYGGRVLSLALTPYLIGMHYRIKYLDELLGWIMNHDDVWVANGSEILDAWKDQQS